MLLVHVYVPRWAIGPITQSWTLATEICVLCIPTRLVRSAVAPDAATVRQPARGAHPLDRRGPGVVVRGRASSGAQVWCWHRHVRFHRAGGGRHPGRVAHLAPEPPRRVRDRRGACSVARVGSGATTVGVVAGWPATQSRPLALWVVSTALDLPRCSRDSTARQTHWRHLLFLVIAAGVVAPSALGSARRRRRQNSPGRTPAAPWRPPPSAARLATGAALASYGVYLWHQWVTREWFARNGSSCHFQAPFVDRARGGAGRFGRCWRLSLTGSWSDLRQRWPPVAAEARRPPRLDNWGLSRSLDGLRGLAILAVLGTHVVFLDGGSRSWALGGGFLGVDVFLGLSAFLIAAVLLQRARSAPRA